MARIPFQYFDPADLEDVVGSPTFIRGARLADSEAVLIPQWTPATKELEGVVRGSGGDLYGATAYFDQFPGSTELFFGHGECSCPVGENCKHVVALVLTAMGANTRTAKPPPPPKPTWEQALRPLLPIGPADHEWHTKSNPIAIELSMPDAVHGRTSLHARLMKQGKNGWINGGLSWSGIGQIHSQAGHPAEQLRILREMYAVYTSSRNRSYYYQYGDQRDIDLTTFDSRQLWALLDEAAAAGIELINSVRPLGTVAHDSEAEFCLDVRRTSASLLITPVIRIDGELIGPTSLAFIGDNGHGLVTKANNLRLRLAKFSTPVPPRLQQMLIDGQVLDIPADEETRFLTTYFPSLRKSATLVSSDETFTTPEISDPVLAMRAKYGDNHDLVVDWEWAYRIGDHDLRAPLDSRGSGSAFRDLDRESEVLARLDLPLGHYGAHSELGGIDTMRFTTELLPLLSGIDGILVDIDGTPADYREAGDSVQIGVSTSAVAKDADWFDLGLTISVEGNQIPFADVFTALSRENTHLLLPNGAYFSLEKPELQTLKRLIEEAKGLQDNADGPLRLSRFQAGLWDEFTKLGVVEEQAYAWRQQVQGLLTLGSVESTQPPASLDAELRPYQLDGFRWLTFLWQHGLGGVLADDMGLGKTIQSLALICHARETDPDAPPFLIIAPTSVVPNWAAECARFAPGLKVVAVNEKLKGEIVDADVVVTSYTRFRLDFDTYSEMLWSALILDEAQFVKNHQSKAYQCVRRLHAPFKLAITGTPMENNLLELWSLLSITAPGLFPSVKRFGDYYRKPIEKQGDAELLAQLRRRIKPLLLRRTKDQVAADLPAKQEQVLELELHPRHQKIYQTHLQRERAKILGLIDDMDKNRFTIFRSLTLLRQLSLDVSLVDDDAGPVPSAKIDALVEQLYDVIDGGHRALIFSQFTGFLAKVKAQLDAEGVKYCYLDGSTRDRGQVVEEFKSGDVPVFLISLKAGGFGLNLTEADYVFILDPWWNPATEAQAVDRTHRIGQTRNVMVYRLIAKDTIEEKVMALKAKKAKLFSSVMDADSMLSSSLSADDIRGLFE
jgi:superfamily II DNA or RNA helicase